MNIKELFAANNSYVIPSYQRNYAWGKVQVEQFIKDVADQLIEGQESYYIGSLIVKQQENLSEYEVIDGQQRHTSLCLLFSALKHLKVSFDLQLNLGFECRERSTSTLAYLFEFGAPSDSDLSKLEPSMVNAFNVATKYFENNFDQISLLAFKHYLLDKVIIVRTCVPEKTDLNHYFEIMNNRGEQLEKHEVIKARLMSCLAENEQATFAKIWDACSNMSSYVAYEFDSLTRIKLFGDDLKCLLSKCNEYINLFSFALNVINTSKDLPSKSSSNPTQSPQSILALYQQAEFKNNKTDSDKLDDEERYRAIIDFPNFLLHVLMICVSNNTKKFQTDSFKVSLDDKKLIEEFNTQILNEVDIEKRADKVRLFVSTLLKVRYLFDNYLIKQKLGSTEQYWGIRTLERKKNEKEQFSIRANNTFGERAETLVMLQSMFNVSYSSKSYKRWLSITLDYLYNSQEVSESGFIEFLQNAAYEQFCSVINIDIAKPLCSQRELLIKGLNKGTSVQNYIFNYLDYKIWDFFESDNVENQSKVSLLLGKCEADLLDDRAIKQFKSAVRKFKFTNRSSVEHHYPQTSKTQEMDANLIDTFANLCLVSSATNSSLGNDYPEGKKKTVIAKHGDKAESLKQRLMFCYNQWYVPELVDLNRSGIKPHGEAMLSLLTSRL